MKYVTTLALLLFFLSQASTQTLPLKVIAAAGNQVKSGNLTLCYTLGELAIHQTTTTSPTLQYREGFWQPDLCVAPDTADNVTPALKLTICAGTTTMLSASGEGTIGWYDAPTGGKYLGGGGQFLQQGVFGVGARLSGPGPRVFDGAQGKTWFKGGHNDSTGNTLVCIEAKRRCLVMLGNSVRAERIYPELTRFILGDTSMPWWWEYGSK